MPTSSFLPKFTITNAIAAGLTRIERGRGFLDAATLSEDWVRAMGARALAHEAHYTTHIEGTKLTVEQSERLWAGEKVPEADPDDARELLNYRKAFDFVSDYLRSGAPVTEGLVREIHKRLVEGVRGGEGKPGGYRQVQNYVVNRATKEIIYTPPAALDVPRMMAELVSWLSADTGVHPVLASGIAQFQLVHIHPFIDGNGRTSRLLSTLCLYRAGYDFKRLFTISEYYDRDRAAFYKAIQDVREKELDLTGWLEFFVEGLSTQMKEVTERGEMAIRADVLGKKHRLNGRQSRALAYVFAQRRMTIQDYERLCPDVNRRTLQRDLELLEKKGLVLASGTAPTDPTRYYEPNPDVKL